MQRCLGTPRLHERAPEGSPESPCCAALSKPRGASPPQNSLFSGLTRTFSLCPRDRAAKRHSLNGGLAIFVFKAVETE